MKKYSIIALVIGALLGVIAGFVLGQNYERDRIMKMQMNSLKYEMDATHRENQAFINKLRKEHPELFKQ